MLSPSIRSAIDRRGRAQARPAPQGPALGRRGCAAGPAAACIALGFAFWMAMAGPGASRAHASIMLSLELPDLVAQADHIAVVDVRSVHSDWDAKHERIYSTIELGVVDLWKTTPPKTSATQPGATPATAGPTTLTIVQPGGTVGDISMVVMGMSRFVPGTRSLVFLRGQADRAQVVGMSQGLHPLTFESATRTWTVAAPALAEVKLVPRASAPVRQPTPAGSPTPAIRSSLPPQSVLPPAATTVSRLNPRLPVALDTMKAEVLRLMATP